MKKLVHYLCKKSPTLYGVIYLLLFMLLLTSISFVPYIYRAVAYPLFYEKQDMSGIIEEVTMQKEDVHVRYKTTDMPTYYFLINDTTVRVTPSIAREYEAGDSFDYIQYSKGDKVIGESREYSLWKGVLGILTEIVVFAISISYFCIDTNESNKREKAGRELPQNIKYSELSTKELYELCLSYNISVIKGKRNNRQYLERCLRSRAKGNAWIREWNEKQAARSKPVYIIFGGIGIFAILIVIINYVKFIYYFIYLFT